MKTHTLLAGMLVGILAGCSQTSVKGVLGPNEFKNIGTYEDPPTVEKKKHYPFHWSGKSYRLYENGSKFDLVTLNNPTNNSYTCRIIFRIGMELLSRHEEIPVKPGINSYNNMVVDREISITSPKTGRDVELHINCTGKWEWLDRR